MQKCSAFGRQSHEWLIFLIVRHSTVVGSAYINYMYIHINGRMNVIFSFCYSVCFFSALFFIVSLLLLAALTAPTLTMLFGFKLYCKNCGYAMNSWHFFCIRMNRALVPDDTINVELRLLCKDTEGWSSSTPVSAIFMYKKFFPLPLTGKKKKIFPRKFLPTTTLFMVEYTNNSMRPIK